MAEDLTANIHSLPPELFNQIREEVLSLEVTISNTEYIHITPAFRFPELLHIDRTSREALAESYYANKVLIFRTAETANKLLMAMEDKHLRILYGFRIVYQDKGPEGDEMLTEMLQEVRRRMEEQGVDFRFAVLSAHILVRMGEPFENESPEQDIVKVWSG